MEATITRLQLDPAQFTLAVNRQAGPHSNVLKVDYQSLRLHLRHWELRERTINTILNMPVGTAVTFKLGATAKPV